MNTKNGCRNSARVHNQRRLEMLSEFFSDSDSDLAAFIANSDEERLLTYGNNGEGKYFLLYPPSYPWSRCGNECTTESAAKRHVLNVIMQFTYDDANAAEIEQHIDFICEVGIG